MPSKKLMNAIEQEDVEKVRKLLEAGVNISPSKAHGDCPVHLAAYVGHAEITKLLIEAGADVHFAEEHGWTALHEASYHEATDVARLLLQAGANPDAKLTHRYWIPEGPDCKKGSTPKTVWEKWELSDELGELFDEFDGKAPSEPVEMSWDIAAASIVYGRAATLECSAEQARNWIAGVFATAAGEGLQAHCMSTSDLSGDEADETQIEIAVGFRVAHAEANLGGPASVAVAAFEQAKQLGKKVSSALWKKLLEGSDFDLGQDCQFLLVASGPLSYAMFVSGELCDADADADAAAADELFAGQDMDQEPHHEGVAGELIASCDDHLEALDPPDEGKSCFIIARYD